jgi:hypothetical protein
MKMSSEGIQVKSKSGLQFCDSSQYDRPDPVFCSTGLRFIDHLVRTRSGEIVAYEIKSGDGFRRLAQKTKDTILETAGGTIIGKNAPAELRDQFRKIRTVELTIK